MNVKEEVKTIRLLDKAANDEFKRFMKVNPNAFPTHNKDWLSIIDVVRDRTKSLFLSLTKSEENVIFGYVPYRVVGEYVVFLDTAAGGSTKAGMQSGHRNFLAVHIRTGMIRKEYFDRYNHPYGWWMNLLKTDDGTATDEEWKEIMRKDSHRRLFERLGIKGQEDK